MTPSIEEAQRLLRLARRDYQTFSILRAHPEADIGPVCFHAQQCVEKALKAAITANEVYFRYTHDLGELFNLATGAGIAPPLMFAEFKRLTPFAVELRYEEGLPLLTREEANHIAARTLEWAEAVVAQRTGPSK